jgi:hypothetical protein
MKKKLIAVCFLVSLLMALVPAGANPVDIKIKKGTYIFIYFNNDSDKDALVPVRTMRYDLDVFAREKATLRIDLRVGLPSPVLLTSAIVDKYPLYGQEETIKLAENKSYVLNENSRLDEVSYENSDNLTIIKQHFSDAKTQRKFELVVLVANSKDPIISYVKIPDRYVAWVWRFDEVFDYLEDYQKKHASDGGQPGKKD